MLPDLERLIHLQDLDSRLAAAEQTMNGAPEREAALDARLAAARAAVDTAKAAIAENQNARRSVDKDLLASQQRLEKYKEQSMAVKTNTEFHAMQHQMEAVKAEIDQFESRVLEVMMQADELAASHKAAEKALAAEETGVAAERKAMEAERQQAVAESAACTAERAEIVRQMDPHVVSTFERIARARGGIGLARAEKERCVVCQVRLRPMVYNEVRRNDAIVQCDSCQRILYYVSPAPGAVDQPAPPAPAQS